MIENRQWRPAAQRSVRNAWGYLQSQQFAWFAASASARSAATNLVNAYLSQGDLGAMDLGVLSDMDGIRHKARIKLRALQEMHLLQYLNSYDTLVETVVEMRKIASSMRTYAKDSGVGPLIEFTKSPMVTGDTGDGGGVAVFASLPLCAFEVLAKDLVTMFQKELKVKWLLASEFHNLFYQSTKAASSKGGKHQFGYFDPMIYIHMSESGELDKLDESSIAIPDRQSKPPSRDTLQVYMTALLAEIHINKDRILEVSRLWSEEMNGGLVGSPQR